MRELRECGTFTAYKRHLKRREQPCEACVQANRRQSREQYWQRGGRQRKLTAHHATKSLAPTRIGVCPTCSAQFETSRSSQRYCSPACRPSVQGWSRQGPRPVWAPAFIRARGDVSGQYLHGPLYPEPVETYPRGGGVLVACPECSLFMFVEGHPSERYCEGCRVKVTLL